jgi:hypothetical protein
MIPFVLLKKWYEICNQIIDIEDTQITFTNDTNLNDISMILYKNMNCKNKELFIQKYIPEILNYIVIQNKIISFETDMSVSCLKGTFKNEPIKKTQTLVELNIVIPNNMIYTEEYIYKKDKKICTYPVEKKTIKTNPNVFKAENLYEVSTNDKSFALQMENPFINTPNNSLKGFRNMSCDIRGDMKDEVDKTQVLMPFNNSSLRSSGPEFAETYYTIQGSGKNDFTPYNEGGIIFSSFGSVAKSLDDIKIANDKKFELEKSKLIIVLINVINPLFFQTVVVIEPDYETLKTIFDYSEYGFIELFTLKTDNDDIEMYLNKQYNGVVFNNAKELNQMLTSTSQFIEYSNNKQKTNKQLLEEEKSVKHYLTKHYDITNDINNKIKAKVLYDTILNEDSCCVDRTKIAGFKNRLSNYLKELNLQKKRYSDGYYYYGIVEKEATIDTMSSILARDDKSLDKLYAEISKQRHELNLEFTEKPDDFFVLFS